MNFIKDLKKAKELQKKTQFSQAATIYEKIISQDKKNFEANVGLSIIYTLTKKISKSIKISKNLIKYFPNRPEPYINYSNILISQHKYKEAINLLLKGHAIKNKNIKILENLSFLYFRNSNFKKFKKFGNLGISLDSKNYFLYNLLGQMYFKEEDIEKSIKYFQLSIKNNKLFWPPYDNLLILFEQTNKIKNFEKLLTITNKVFKKTSHINRLNFFNALLRYRNNDFEQSLNLLKELGKNISFTNPKHLQSYYDLLGRNYDKIKNYNLAFKNFKIRNELVSKLEENSKYDKRKLLDLIISYKKYFVKKNISKFTKFKKIDNFKDPVFLIGFPRSGTTLLDTILRTHSQTNVLEEKPYIAQIRDNFFKSKKNLINSIEKVDIQSLKNMRSDYFKNLSNNLKSTNSKIIIDKLPLNILEIGFINRVFPKSKFILMMRHPCDSILSCFLTDFKINEAMIHFLNLDDSVKFYDEVFCLWKQYNQNLKVNFHLIKYEDVIYNFDATIKSLLKFLNIQWENNLKFFNKTAIDRIKINTPSYNQVIKPLNANSISRWKNYNEFNQIKDKLKVWIEYFDYK